MLIPFRSMVGHVCKQAVHYDSAGVIEAAITVMKIARHTVGVNGDLKTVLSEKPIKIEKVGKKFLDRQILRLAVVAELDAISLYEQLAEATENEAIRRVLLDVAMEEKTHVGEFQTLLLREDEVQRDELKKGRQEVEEELKV